MAERHMGGPLPGTLTRGTAHLGRAVVALFQILGECWAAFARGVLVVESHGRRAAPWPGHAARARHHISARRPMGGPSLGTMTRGLEHPGPPAVAFFRILRACWAALARFLTILSCGGLRRKNVYRGVLVVESHGRRAAPCPGHAAWARHHFSARRPMGGPSLGTMTRGLEHPGPPAVAFFRILRACWVALARGVLVVESHGRRAAPWPGHAARARHHFSARRPMGGQSRGPMTRGLEHLGPPAVAFSRMFQACWAALATGVPVVESHGRRAAPWPGHAARARHHFSAWRPMGGPSCGRITRGLEHLGPLAVAFFRKFKAWLSAFCGQQCIYRGVPVDESHGRRASPWPGHLARARHHFSARRPMGGPSCGTMTRGLEHLGPPAVALLMMFLAWLSAFCGLLCHFECIYRGVLVLVSHGRRASPWPGHAARARHHFSASRQRGGPTRGTLTRGFVHLAQPAVALFMMFLAWLSAFCGLRMPFWCMSGIWFVTGGWLLLVQQLPPDIPFHLSVKAYIANTDCGFPVLPTHRVDFGPITLAFGIGVMINRDSRGHSYFIVRGARRRLDTVLVSTINDADQGSADVAFRTPLAPYEKSKFLGSEGSMVARLKLKGIDGRAPPGVEPAA
ncbi:hypothetical protein R6Q57_001390 [Mikania cordata]